MFFLFLGANLMTPRNILLFFLVQYTNKSIKVRTQIKYQEKIFPSPNFHIIPAFLLLLVNLEGRVGEFVVDVGGDLRFFLFM